MLLLAGLSALGVARASAACGAPGGAVVVPADGPSGPLGLCARYLVEPAQQPLTLEQAALQWQQGAFRPVGSAVASFGIGSRPVWLQVTLDNPRGDMQAVRIHAGAGWIDRLDLALLQDGRVLRRWHSGDATPDAAGLVPGIGFTFDASLPPGRSALLVRAETPDPMLLPLALTPTPAVAAEERQVHYGYGLLYGALMALIGVNAALYSGLRARGHMNYALYLLSFIVMNIAYTGHGQAWWWSGRPELQRYVILVLMLLFCCSGLLFATRFLELARLAPRVRRVVYALALAALAAMAALVAIGHQAGAALLAFSAALAFVVGMVALGVVSLRRGHPAARYFLAAAASGMLGAATTTLAVWGAIPLNAATFHGVEAGVVLEALLLALALASRMRHQEKARLEAEALAGQDTLTGLPNRRAFLAAAAGPWSTATRHDRPLSVVLLDVDHFKQINDQHGHDAGDRALVALAGVLSAGCRSGDLVSRWGGEEFVLLLPETALDEAGALAERMRQTIQDHPVEDGGRRLVMTASFGVAQRTGHATLDDLIREADQRLYDAKRAGRNRVAGQGMRVKPGPDSETAEGPLPACGP